MCQQSALLGGSKTEHSSCSLQQSATCIATSFPKSVQKEFRHVSQQRADILNIFYDGECNINYYI
jgi:hypothetical protein